MSDNANLLDITKEQTVGRFVCNFVEESAVML